MDEPKLQEEGYALMAAAFEVHKVLGGGLAEEIYQESLEIELEMRGIPFKSKPATSASYKNHVLKSNYFPDLVTDDGLMIELKAVSRLLPEHEAQPVSYTHLTLPTKRIV